MNFINNEMAMYADEYIKESYTLLEESLKESLDNVGDLFTRTPNVDYLEALQNRIDYCKANYDLMDEDKDLLNTLNQDIVRTIFTKFSKEFNLDVEDLEKVFTGEVAQYDIANCIYVNLYLNRKDLISKFLVNYVFNNKKGYVRNYRNNKERKDVEFYSMRKEFEFKNNDYYFIILNYLEILEDIINADNQFAIDEFMLLSEVNLEDQEVLNEIFNNADVSPVDYLMKSLINSDFYNDFLIQTKIDLINTFKQTK